MKSRRARGHGPTRQVVQRILLLGSLALPGGCATFSSGDGSLLHEEIEQIISSPPLDQLNWGIRIADPERGQILYSRHAHLKFIPASNMKLLSTATALSLLGPEYRYQTELYGIGSVEEGGSVLHGDLLLRGSGDPTFSERFFPSAEAPLDSLAQGLWAAGIRSVTGSLVLDVSAWDSTTVPGTWMVGDLSGTSGATGGAFTIAEGVLSVEVTAGVEVGAPAQARWWPFLRWWPFPGDPSISVDYVTVHPDSSTRGRSVGYLPESRRLELGGKIRMGEVDTLRVSQRDPVRLAAAALLHALERRGIEVQGRSRIAWEVGETVGSRGCTTGPDVQGCSDAFRITGLNSPPLAEIVKGILEPSQNWMTEQLVRTLGAERGEGGSWREGFGVEEDFLTREVGVDSLDIIFRDGSGMSTQDLVTPRALVRILEYMRNSPHSEIFRDALASPREEDSTLRNRLTTLEGRVFAKTGTLTHVTSLSGYLITTSGRELIFSILTNGSGVSSAVVRNAIDQIVEATARH